MVFVCRDWRRRLKVACVCIYSSSHLNVSRFMLCTYHPPITIISHQLISYVISCNIIKVYLSVPRQAMKSESGFVVESAQRTIDPVLLDSRATAVIGLGEIRV